MLTTELPREVRLLVEKAERIAGELVTPLAPVWDRENRFPHELFSELHKCGLNAMTVPPTYGGLGWGPDIGDPLPVWLVTRALAYADSASSHCQQVHTNMCHAVAVLGTEAQQERYLRAVSGEGAVVGGWGSEQSGEPSVETFRTGTIARRAPGGWEITGTKFYSTNAGAARYAIVFAYPEDAADPIAELLLCMVDCQSPGVSVQPEWWDRATGMRATVSHEVKFDRVFVGEDEIIGPPGSYWSKQLQARYLPQFSANFQGVGAHVFDYGLRYVRERGRAENALIQHRMAEARLLLVTAELLLARTAELYRAGSSPDAFHYSRMLRAYSQSSVQQVLDLVQAVCGASIYMHPHPTERILRDWQFYSRHENRDLILGAIGQREFGVGVEGTAESFGFARS